MRKDNPPIENPILNLMDKRKKKLHFRYTNTDFIIDSFYNILSEPGIHAPDPVGRTAQQQDQ